MKKIFFAAFAGLLCICTSCDNNKPVTADNGNHEMEQKNIAAFNTVSKAFETGNITSVDSVVADDYVDHTDHGEVKGKDSLKAMIMQMHTSFPDTKTETKNTAVSGDYVYGWMHSSGTSDGSMGIPKGHYDMSSIELVKFNNDGKATEHWSFMQPSDMMKMMGPQPGMDKMNDMNVPKKKMDSAATMK